MMKEMERAAAEAACAKLINQFANFNDARRYEELAGLFVEEGAFARPTVPDQYIEGRQAILEGFRKRPADKITRHVITNITIDVISETEARGFSYVLLYTADADNKAEKFGLQAQPAQFLGEFEDEFRKTDDGWKFVRRSGSISMTV